MRNLCGKRHFPRLATEKPAVGKGTITIAGSSETEIGWTLTARLHTLFCRSRIHKNYCASSKRKNENMNLKISPIIGLLALCLTVKAQQVPVSYQFTINSGYVLTNAYFIDTEPEEAYAFITPLEINGQNNFPYGSYQSVFPGGTTYGANCVTIIGVVTATSTGATTIGVTMPLSLANNFVLTNGTWTNYAADLRPFGNLPNAQTTISDLQSGSDFFLQTGYGYLPTNSAVLQAYGQLGQSSPSMPHRSSARSPSRSRPY